MTVAIYRIQRPAMEGSRTVHKLWLELRHEPPKSGGVILPLDNPPAQPHFWEVSGKRALDVEAGDVIVFRDGTRREVLEVRLWRVSPVEFNGAVVRCGRERMDSEKL